MFGEGFENIFSNIKAGLDSTNYDVQTESKVGLSEWSNLMFLDRLRQKAARDFMVAFVRIGMSFGEVSYIF